MAQKISGIKLEKTTEQDRVVWAEVFSHRNKLLLNSDWTQIADSGLTDECAGQWKDWRRQLKNITRANFGDPSVAEHYISNLARRQPFNSYKPTDLEPDTANVVSLDGYRERVVQYMDSLFNSRANFSFPANQFLVDEQHKEATLFLSKTKGKAKLSFPLIDLEVAASGKTQAEVAEEFVATKTSQVARILMLKQKYNYFLTLVNNASSDVELTSLQLEIKTWILTST